MAMGPRVAYRVTTVKVSQDQSVAFYCRFKNCPNTHHIFVSHLRGKLYMKQACAATSHSALVSQKMAMLH